MDPIVEVIESLSSEKKNTIRVLNVDDDSRMLEVSKKILMLEGDFEIENAHSVDEPFKKLSTNQYDVIVSDYEMPQKNGLQFLKELCKQNNSIPFILFTGKSRGEVSYSELKFRRGRIHKKTGQPQNGVWRISIFSA